MGSKGGRPAKINKERLEKAKLVLADGNNIVCLTDEDLLDEINSGLHEEHQINKRTFERYKAGYVPKNAEEQRLLDEFCRLLKEGLRLQKKNLMVKMTDEKQHRTKRARIIERKFDEWNIRHKTENVHKEVEELEEKEKVKLDELYDEVFGGDDE